MPEPGRDGKFVRINWQDAGRALFANNVIVQRDEGVIHLMFYQVNPPLIIAETEEERRKQFQGIEFLEAQPIARIALPEHKLLALVKALEKQVLSDKEEKNGSTT